MDRINGADTVDIGGGKRGFQDEDLLGPVTGTEVTALWLNMVQEEILHVISDAEMAPDDADWGQLSAAIGYRIRHTPLSGFLARGTTALIPANVKTVIGAWLTVKNMLVNSTFDPVTGQLTIGAEDSGWWLLLVAATVPGPDTATTEGVHVLRNGVTLAYQQAQNIAPGNTGFTVTCILELAAGDVVSGALFHTQAASQAITAETSFFSAIRMPSPVI